MIKDLLQKLDLPKNAAIVFDFLLTKKESKATEIIKYTGVHRYLVYESLKYLEREKLVKKVIKQGVGHYRVLNVQGLVKEAEEKYQAATKISNLVKQRRAHPETSATFYEGIEGVHSFTEHVLEVGQTVNVLGGNARFREFFPEIFDLWNERRQQKNILFKTLVPQKIPQKMFKGIPLFEYRRFNAKMFPGVMWIFGSYIAHITWTTKETTEIIMIKNPILAKQQIEFFNYIWKQNN